MSVYIWLLAALVLAVIEMLTVDLIFIMLAAGALGAAIGAWLLPDTGYSIAIEVGIFCLISVLLLALVRPFFKKKLAKTQPQVDTNVYALVGKPAKVIETVTAHCGLVRLAGEVWTARTEEANPISPKTQVWVDRIEGATAVVISSPK